MRGEISFIAAGVITDIAFSLLRRADEEFTKISPFDSTEWSDLLRYLGIDYFVFHGHVWMHPSRDHQCQEPRMPHSSVNIVELLCPVAFLCLEQWKGEVDEYCKIQKQPKDGGDPETYQSHDTHLFHNICELLSYNVKVIHQFAHSRSPEERARDELMRALVDIHTTSSIPMWAVVACQASMDILDLLGDHFRQGADILVNQLCLVEKLRQDLEAYNPTGKWNDPKVRDAMARFRSLRMEILSYTRSGEQKPKYTKSLRAIGEERPRHERGFKAFLMVALPGFAGHLLAEFQLILYELSIAFARHGDHVLTIAHIYRALIATGLLDHTWQDMEFAISSFAPKDSLVAKPAKPYDGQRAQRHYLMALGINPGDLNQGAQDKDWAKGKYALKDRTHSGTRAIEISSPILAALCGRATAARNTQDAKTFEAIIRALALPDNTKVINQKHLKTSPEASRYSATELLASLRRKMLRDEPTLNFDFISLTFDCSRLLDSLGAGLEGSERKGFDCASTLRLLHTHASSQAGVQAANFFRAYIISHGKKHSQNANDQSSNRIPKHLRPVIEAKRDFTSNVNSAWCFALDESDIKHSLSGRTLAAYHKDFMLDDDCSSIAETQPRSFETSAGGMTMLSVIVPLSKKHSNEIADKGVKSRGDDADPFKTSLAEALRDYAQRNLRGEVSDDEMRRLAGDVLGLELVKWKVPPSHQEVVRYHPDVWIFHIPKSHGQHTQYRQKVMESLRNCLASSFEGFPTFEDHWLAIPLSRWTITARDHESLRRLHLETSFCAIAALRMEQRVECPDKKLLDKLADAMKDLDNAGYVEVCVQSVDKSNSKGVGVKGR